MNKAMRDDILSNLDNPRQLETLYRANKATFKTAFDALYPELPANPLAEGWHHRLHYAADALGWGTAQERVFVVVASAVAALLAKLPALFSLNPESFYPRNVAFIVFPALMAWFGWKNRLPRRAVAGLAGAVLFALVFINVWPQGERPADTFILACLHLPLGLWTLLGFVFAGATFGGRANWLGFLRYNGDLAVMTALLLIAGGLTTALTINLFMLIGWRIEEVYFNYVVVCGLAALPVVATFLTQTQPALVGKISPVIANLFSPVALVMLVVYLGAALVSGRDPYQNRDVLLLFNGLLLGVMALIFFSVAGPEEKQPAQRFVLFALSVVTVLINGIALSAVLLRIAEGGLTPNRLAVLGANVLMLAHLLYMSATLFRALNRPAELSAVGRSMRIFLPVYGVWSAVVTFGFPLLFEFR